MKFYFYANVRYKLQYFIEEASRVASYDQDIPLDRTMDINIMLFSSKLINIKLIFITFRLRQFEENLLLVWVNVEHHGEKVAPLQRVDECGLLHDLSVGLLPHLLQPHLLPLLPTQNLEYLPLILLGVQLTHSLVHHLELEIHQLWQKCGHITIKIFGFCNRIAFKT